VECLKSYIKENLNARVIMSFKRQAFRAFAALRKYLPRIGKKPENRSVNSETTMVWPKD